MVKKKDYTLTEEDKLLWEAYKNNGGSNIKGFSHIPIENKQKKHPLQAISSHKVVTTNSPIPVLSQARDLKNIHIQGRLDLHGKTLNQAHDHLVQYILSAHQANRRCVLIITGKGSKKEGHWWEESGILREKVPRWLNEEPLRSKVITYATAKPEHGGTGALYVYIKK